MYLTSLGDCILEAGVQGESVRAGVSRQGVLTHEPCRDTRGITRTSPPLHDANHWPPVETFAFQALSELIRFPDCFFFPFSFELGGEVKYLMLIYLLILIHAENKADK